jgi:hypothetical protein
MRRQAIKIDRVVIFGDSMSDIGHKRVSGMGRIARSIGAMRTNKVGRFSDGKNWTDFLWEWSGGQSMFERDASRTDELSKHHMKLGKFSRFGAPARNGFSYVNYAEGGAMGASDRFGMGLGTFKAQVKSYTDQIKQGNVETGNVLHIIWFGLNDLVTNGRSKDKMKAVAVEMCGLCEKIMTNCGGKAYFLFANIPNPQGAVRYMNKEDTQKVRDFQTGAFEFGYELARQVSIFPDNRADLLDMYTPMEHVNENVNFYKIKKGAQPHGMKVRYGKINSDGSDRYWATTSDEAHPSEHVYKIIAKIFATNIQGRYNLGLLSNNLEKNFAIA